MILMSPDLDDTGRNGQVHDWGSWTVVMDNQRSSSQSNGSPIVWLDVNVQRPTKPFTQINEDHEDLHSVV